jgi:hypothetical protein
MAAAAPAPGRIAPERPTRSGLAAFFNTWASASG